MTVLNTLKLVAATKPLALNPVLFKRNKFIAKLSEQQALAQAQQDGKTYAPTKQKKVTDADTGVVSEITVAKRVKAWWWTGDGGRLLLGVRYGNKVMELAKGRAAVEVGGVKELVSVLTTLRKATEAGELDAQIEAASVRVRKGFKR